MFKIIKSIYIFVVVGGLAFAQQAQDEVSLNEPLSVQRGILPIQKILNEARAKEASGVDVKGATRDGNFILKPTGNRARVYTVGPLGLELVRTGRQILAPAGDTTPEADAEDGSDTTAFDNIGSPLDAAHLESFKLCKNSRTEQGINNLNAYWMSALSSIAYLKYPLAFDRLKQMKFESIYFIEGPSDVEVVVGKIAPKKDEQGNIIKDSGLSVVAFRGTDNAEDWLTNLNATTSDISGHEDEAWLHDGFALALHEVYGEILKILDLPNNPSPLYITGHSLGGALGMQMAIRLVSRESADVNPLIGPKDDRLRGVYVFAIPRVGNNWARNILDKYMNRTKNVSVHVHHNADPTGKVPFDWMGYKRIGLQTVVPYSSKDDLDYGNRGTWACHADADYRGPGAFEWDLWHTSIDAHYMEAYAKHFAPWRSRLAQMTCDDAIPSWGPRFVEEDAATFKPLRTSAQVGKNACDYSAFSWGGNVQL